MAHHPISSLPTLTEYGTSSNMQFTNSYRVWHIIQYPVCQLLKSMAHHPISSLPTLKECGSSNIQFANSNRVWHIMQYPVCQLQKSMADHPEPKPLFFRFQQYETSSNICIKVYLYYKCCSMCVMVIMI